MVIVSFRTGSPQVVAVIFLTAAVYDQSHKLYTSFSITTNSLSDSIMEQLAATQEATTLLNPWSRQRHVSLVDRHVDCGKEIATHPSYSTVGQHAVFCIKQSNLCNLHHRPESQKTPSRLR